MIPGVDVKILQGIKRSAVFDLVHHIAENGIELKGWFEYDSGLFEAETVTRMARYFQNLLECAANRPDTHISELVLLEKSEIITTTQQWNATTAAYPSDRCIHELFEAQAEKTPEAVAVVFEDSRLTYRELNARADHLARRLRHLGVRPDTLVGLFLRPSADVIVGILGILKADGGYVPIDPSYPMGRVQYVLDDCKAASSVRQILP